MGNIKRLGGSVNSVVVQLEERHYPGVVIQGDSINNLLRLVEDIRSQIEKGDVEEASYVAQEVERSLRGYKAAIDDVCRA